MQVKVLLLGLFGYVGCHAFQSLNVGKTQRMTLQARLSNECDKHDSSSSVATSRREALTSSISTFLILAASASSSRPAQAEEAQKTIYLTGKQPKVPGQKPRDKNDVTGTRKDPNFLRSISDCKNQCETKTSSDGTVKSKEDCLSECQDICCTTYEQCTFAIVPRI